MAESYSLEQDLKEAEAMAEALVPYVHEDALYGSAGRGGFFSRMPSLTIGALLMRLRRLNVMRDQLSDKQRSRLEAVETRNRSVLNEWRVHYEKKMLREANSRLDAMRQFFDEAASNPRLAANVYKPEALRRTIVEEIAMAMEDLNIESEELQQKRRGIDSQLRRYIAKSEFLWDEALRPAYPESTFWWLYQQPIVPNDR